MHVCIKRYAPSRTFTRLVLLIQSFATTQNKAAAATQCCEFQALKHGLQHAGYALVDSERVKLLFLIFFIHINTHILAFDTTRLVPHCGLPKRSVTVGTLRRTSWRTHPQSHRDPGSEYQKSVSCDDIYIHTHTHTHIYMYIHTPN
jgi:hypothetical protein